MVHAGEDLGEGRGCGGVCFLGDDACRLTYKT